MKDKTIEELENIVRKAENVDVRGSQYQRARAELEFRERNSSWLENP